MPPVRLRSAQIFKVNQLGDNVVFLPVMQKLVADRTFERLTLWTTPIAAPLYGSLASQGLRLEISPYHAFYPAWKNPLHLARLMFRARSARADIALVAEDMGNTAYFLARVCGARSRLGTTLPYIRIPNALTESIPLDPTAPAAKKAWILGRRLAEAAGASPWPDRPPPPDLEALIDETHFQVFDFLIHPGASRSYQRWPIERYQDLAARLARKHRVGWIVVNEFQAPAPPGTTPLAPVALHELVSLIARARVFIGNNSGPMNLASALGTPGVILVGPSARSWDPYWYPERFLLLREESLPCIACDPPGLPIKQVCTNTESPMACLKAWSVDRVETEALAWYARGLVDFG